MISSLLKDPIGFVPPVSVSSGGGSATTGAATFRYTSLTDPPAPEFELDVDEGIRLTLNPEDVGFDQTVSNNHITLRPDGVAFEHDVDLPIHMTINPNDVGFSQEVEEVRISVDDIPASQDTWVNDLAVCTGNDNNHDGTDLQIEGTATSKKTAFVEWPTSMLTAATSITRLVITLNVKTTIATGSTTLRFDPITSSWSEGSISCSSKPSIDNGSSASDPSAIANTFTGDYDIDLTGVNSDFDQYLIDAMGSSDWGVQIGEAFVAGLNRSYESKDEGTGDNLGPRLSLTFTVPV